jgi:hypothetical protein
MIRTMIVAGRRGGASSQADAAGGDHIYYVASVLGGRGDLKVVSEDGVTQAPVAAPGRSLEVMAYASGPAPTLNGGYGWNGSGEITTPYAQLVGREDFETYALGGISGSGLTAGMGWNGSAALSSY